jgi:hypothetical protein
VRDLPFDTPLRTREMLELDDSNDKRRSVEEEGDHLHPYRRATGISMPQRED